jgi:hypothetical protein
MVVLGIDATPVVPKDYGVGPIGHVTITTTA